MTLNGLNLQSVPRWNGFFHDGRDQSCHRLASFRQNDFVTVLHLSDELGNAAGYFVDFRSGCHLSSIQQVEYEVEALLAALALSPAWAKGGRMSEHIEINPRVCGGQPVIKGTRISVAAILDQLAANESWDCLLEGYPELQRTDIQAAIQYAKNSVLHTEITALDTV